jgi:hypothetical protein
MKVKINKLMAYSE